MPWYLRWGLILPFVLAALGLAWWAYGSGLELGGFYRGKTREELSRLREQVTRLQEENAQLSNQIAQSERQIQIERASNQETTKQLKNLTEENSRIQEDLAFFQNITATRGKEGELAIHRLKLESDKIPGEYRLRMLLVQSGQCIKGFTGNYQVVASVLENGSRTTRLFPENASGNAQFQLNFKYYQRIEQSIQLPPGMRLEGVQVRIFEQGAIEPRIRQSVTLS